jgi:hypothetical protein
VWRSLRAASLAPALTGLGLGLLALGPGLGRGFLLSYDMVFVPRMPFSAALLGLTGGPPRAVPSDTVVAVASLVLPADFVQKIILLLIFVLACSGAAALLDSAWAARNAGGAPDGAAAGGGAPLLARLAAGACYAWNPYVAERLQLGQWALLLGYAGLPWVVRVLCTGPERVRLGRLVCVMIPAAIGGVAAMSVTALAAVPVALASPGGRARRLLTVVAALGLLSLPWLIPALAVPVHTDPRGIDAFAPRADTPFGRVGSLLLLSGIWNPQTVPPGFRGAASAFWLLLVIASACGYVLLVRPGRLRSAPGSRLGASSPLAPVGLAIAALAGLAIAAVAATSPGRAALRDLVTAWPGFAVLRDGQKFLAPLALAEAIGLGALAAGVSTRVSSGVRAGAARPRHPAAAALAAMAVLAPVVLLPGMAWGMAGRLRPAEYPADWLRARQVIDGDPARGSVLLLPWAAYRNYPWNYGQAVFDPWARFTGREVISNDGLAVGSRTLAQESADSIRLNRIVTSRGPLTGALRAAGVRYVVVDAGPLLARADTLADQDARALAAQARLPGARLVIVSRDLLLFRLPQSGGNTPAAVGRKLPLGQHIVFSPASSLRLGRCCRCGDSPLRRVGSRYKEDHRVTSRTDHRGPRGWGGARGGSCVHDDQRHRQPAGPVERAAVQLLQHLHAVTSGTARTPVSNPLRLCVLIWRDAEATCQ